MKARLICSAAALVMLFGQSAQSRPDVQYVDPDKRYKLNLIGNWRAVTYGDAVGRQKTEFVYGDRREGLLRISKEAINGSIENMIREEEENSRIYRSGFERAGVEAFGGGALSGVRFSFHTTEGGRRIANIYYYLREGNSVWILRFNGRRESVDTNRNIIDQIARSFQPM
jgi:hypothetical protein